jgi:hypothetical protein
MARAVYCLAYWADGAVDRFKVRGPALLPKLLGHTTVTVGRTVHTRNVDVVRNPRGHEPHLRHEATHVRQYRRYGVVGFLWRYLTGQRAQLEAEGRAAETAVWPVIRPI